MKTDCNRGKQIVMRGKQIVMRGKQIVMGGKQIVIYVALLSVEKR